MYVFQVTNTDVTSYDEVGSSYQKNVFWHFIHFYFFKLGGVNYSTQLFQRE